MKIKVRNNILFVCFFFKFPFSLFYGSNLSRLLVGPIWHPQFSVGGHKLFPSSGSFIGEVHELEELGNSQFEVSLPFKASHGFLRSHTRALSLSL